MEALRRFIALVRATCAPAVLAVGFISVAVSAMRAQDFNPPTVGITPNGGVYELAGQSVTVYWCDDVNLSSITRAIMFNGTSVKTSFGYAAGSDPSCGESKQSSGNVTLVPGSNSFSATICDGGGNCGSQSISWNFGAWLTPHFGSVSVPGSSSQSYTFVLKNTTTTTRTYTFDTPSCTGAVSSCTTPNALTLNGGASGNATVNYNAGTPGTTGGIMLVAGSSGGAIYDVGYVSVTTTAVPPTISVTPDGQSVNAPSGIATSQSFTVAVSGNPSTTYTVTFSPINCSGTLTGCSTPSSIALFGNSSVQVSANYTPGAVGTTGTVTLTASVAGYTGVTDNGSINVTSTTPPVVAVVTPDGQAVTVQASSAQSYGFQVANAGTNNGAFTFSTSCTGSITGCSTPSGVVISGGTSQTITVNYTAGASGTTGTVTLTATGSDPLIGGSTTTDNGSINVTASSSPATVAVTPDGQGVTAPPSTARTQTFSVQNTSGTTTQYNLTTTCSGALNGCSVQSQVSVGGNSSSSVVVSYNSGANGTTGTVTLRAEAAGNPSNFDTGSINVTSAAVYAVAVTPDNSTVTVTANSPNSQTFTVNNTGNVQASYSFAVTCSGHVSGCSTPANVNNLGFGAQASVTVNYNSGATGQTNGLVKLRATVVGRTETDSGWVNVSTFQSALAVSTLYNNYSNHRVDLCDAGCFAARYAVTTVPFFSGGQPRSVTLLYDGDAVAVRPILTADARIVPGGPALQEFWFEAKDSTGAFITFLNGDTKLRFAAPATPNSKVRLSGQFDAASLGYTTGVYPVTFIVTAKYTSGTTEAQTITTKFLVINERKSYVARGWTVGGVSRVKVQGPDALLVEGGGSAAFFTGCGAGCYNSPPGDFTRLRSTGSGTGLMFYRDFPDSSRAEYDYLGQLTRLITRTLDSTTFEYDVGTGLLRRMWDPYRTDGAGNHLYTYFMYGPRGLTNIIEPGPNNTQEGGRQTAFVITEDTTLQYVTDPDGGYSILNYDGQRRLLTIRNRRADVTTLTYDENSWKLATTVSPAFAVDPRIYGAGQTRQLTTTYRPWQTAAVPTSSTASTPAAAVLADTIRGAVTDAGGHVVAFTVNRWGQSMVTTTLPGSALARVDSVFRDTLNVQVTKVRRHEGGVDVFDYTGPFLTYTQLAGQNAVTTQYGAFGQVTKISGTGIPTQDFKLGLRGRVDTAIVAGTVKTKYAYDARQRVTSVTDPAGHTTMYHYDATFGNLDSTLAPGARGSRIKFDGFGRDSASRTSTQPWRSTRYDLVNRPTVVKLDAAGSLAADSTITQYDDFGNVTQVTDPAGNSYQYQYNALGFVTQETDPAGNAAKYFFDAEAVPTSKLNRRGDSLWTAVDAQHRPVANTIKVGTAVVRRDSMFYDPAGLWSAAHNAVSRDTVFNDATGWTTSTVTRLATDWNKRVQVRYTKDASARLDSVLVAFPGAIAPTWRRYTWNSSTSTLAAVELNGSSVSFGYDTELIPTTVTQPGGLSRTLSPSTIHALYKAGYSTTGADTLLWRGVALDSLGRAARQFAYANSSINKTQYTYRYDPRGRLVAVHDSTVFPTNTCGDDADFGVKLCAGYTALLQWKDSLSFDRLGNVTYANGFTGVGSATYDKNRITSWPGYNYTFDAEGNVTQRAKVGGATNNFFWSADGLLDSVVVGARKIRYDYNALGQLARRRVDGASGATRHFFWDQGHLLAELDSTLSNRVAEYAYYPGTDSPMALVTGATTVTATRYVQLDLQGSVIGLTTSSGTVDNAVIVSRPWGEYAFWSNAGGPGLDTLRLRWKGLFYEGDSTQLYYVRARWYDPVIHRFLTQDPIGLEGGLNPYTFASNDPANASDPSGLLVECTTTYIYYTHTAMPEVHVSCTRTSPGGGTGFYFPPRPGGLGIPSADAGTWTGGYGQAKMGGPPPRLPNLRYLSCVTEVARDNFATTHEGIDNAIGSGISSAAGFAFGRLSKTQGVNLPLLRYAGEVALGKSHPQYGTQYIRSRTFFRPTFTGRLAGETVTGLGGLTSLAVFNILKGVSIQAAFDGGVAIGSAASAAVACR